MDRRWVQRLIDEERLPALWLVVAGIVGITIANVVGADTISHVLEFGVPSMSVHRLDRKSTRLNSSHT